MIGGNNKMGDDMKSVVIYTDGACSGNPGPGGYGVVLMHEGKEKELSGGYKDTTNNQMEITAVIEGLKALKLPCNVKLYSDSTYVVDSITKGWVYSWKKNNWIKSNKEKAKNIDLWEELLILLNVHNVQFIKVKGHSDNEYNNRCDKLARQAIEKM
jgi:ribonuclease HI